MKKIGEIQKRQGAFIAKQVEYIQSLSEEVLFPNPRIQSCLISGSVARGTYMPGDMESAIDIVLFVDNINNFNRNNELGPDRDTAIPGHVIQFKNIHYQIKIYDNNYLVYFNDREEAGKYAFLESRILFDKTGSLQDKINAITENAKEPLKRSYMRSLDHAHYLINAYKVERWKKRDAVIQLNSNLNRSIDTGIKCLFYLNGQFMPAEDRALYFSFSLPRLPENYEHIMHTLFLVKKMSLSSYITRESLFKETILAYLDKNKTFLHNAGC